MSKRRVETRALPAGTYKFGDFDLEVIEDALLTSRSEIPIDTETTWRLLTKNLHFAKDKARNLYVYENGVYKLAEDKIKKCCAAVYRAYEEEWNMNRDRQLTEYLLIHARELLEVPLSNVINLKNGLYFIETGVFESHDKIDHSSYLTTIQLPTIYDPNAECPKILQFFREVLPEGPEFLIDNIGVCMTSDTKLHSAVIMKGGGNNGKSLYIYLLRTMVGDENISVNTMHSLANPIDKFVNSSLVGKLVNISDDEPQGKILDAANVKSIISGGLVRLEGKFEKPVWMKPYCKLIVGTNHDLESSDDTPGFKRRIVEVPFRVVFPKNPNKERELQDTFDDPMERSGLFNLISKRLSSTLKNGLAHDASPELDNLIKTFHPPDTLADGWLTFALVEKIDGKIDREKFNADYRMSVRQSDTDQIIFKAIKRVFPNVTLGRGRFGGEKIQCYIGVIISEAEREWYDNMNMVEGNEYEEELEKLGNLE